MDLLLLLKAAIMVLKVLPSFAYFQYWASDFGFRINEFLDQRKSDVLSSQFRWGQLPRLFMNIGHGFGVQQLGS